MLRSQKYLCFFVVTCTSLDLENGKTSYSPSTKVSGRFPLNTVASFSCNGGYHREGCESTTCRISGTSGEWDQIKHLPTCKKGNKVKIY